MDLNRRIRRHLEGHAETLSRLSEMEEGILDSARAIAEVLSAGGRVYLAGNGGSAADAQHIAAEMEGRFRIERPARAVHCLTCNSSTFSSIANDYGFDQVFSRQVEGFLEKGDLLILISTSGQSPNLVSAAKSAKEKGVSLLALLGRDGGELLALCERNLLVPSAETAWIQEAHITLGHMLCDLVDEILEREGL
ncbi:MAG: SIS domain-containing protein [Candidatus Krumholzibacteria bacterium]|jgi:D-sedoheptulose 7-phosphate isomerase|nr:SIS domain-containing protein [Candidatus Krumholzibacteria bacterium]MDP6669333.1 SIS domain-containing protein [Candidatus Krumholzibacteria bacterium]MDP6796772.1 SIS domain-containing protein [Candidatus Krumholzibacteria bacterium]MDP7021674.1 SIS domain-containing protein [Candidatus Krumholzibacteria bacterium]